MNQLLDGNALPFFYSILILWWSQQVWVFRQRKSKPEGSAGRERGVEYGASSLLATLINLQLCYDYAGR